MKVVGLITEYNPFHNGHAYHIQEAKKITGADYVVVVMSGNFVQRGAPSFMDKYTRAKMALQCGADIVFELPVCFACASAEYFAHGSISLLDKLGIIDFVCFGSESGDIQKLTSVATILNQESEIFKENLFNALKAGKTYPQARMEAISSLNDSFDETLLTSPNNTLGVEYIRAIHNLKSSITPVTITRAVTGYHNEDLTITNGLAISSATAIRKNLNDIESLHKIKAHVPSFVFSLMNEHYKKTFPITENDFSSLLYYSLLSQNVSSLSQYLDINQDLANRIMKYAGKSITYEYLAEEIKSKQWTLTRINRALLHILLNIKTDQIAAYKNAGFSQYARLLGVKKNASHLLRLIKKEEKIPVITKVGSAGKLLSPLGLDMLQTDILASNLYNQIVYHKYGTKLADEYTHGVILMD